MMELSLKFLKVLMCEDTHRFSFSDEKRLRRTTTRVKSHASAMLIIALLGLVISACDVLVEAAQDRVFSPIEETPTPAAKETVHVDIPFQRSEELLAGRWMSFPVVPEVTNTALEIALNGIEMGNNPHAFSKVGDCQNVPSLFLASFDDPRQYILGAEYAYLQDVIDWFADSYSRESLAVRGGFNAASVLSPIWANPDICEPGETPLACEYRVHKPIIAVISLETWWEKSPEDYERYLREIIRLTIDAGVVPILSTKADNLEGDHQINATIVKLGAEYDIPIWNFWRSVQNLPDGGLHEDGFHLTYAANHFDDPVRMLSAWPWRNLTALMAMDEVWRGIIQPE
jgi:hypothetical protein